ncbi:MAG: DUF5076 domain-containing protein [Reyranellales bacterium]
MADCGQLVIPDPAQKDPKSLEVVRAWIADGGLHVSLRPDVWSDVGTWGILLADLARHVANSFEQQKGLDRATTLKRIKALVDAELSSPTDEPSGRIID